MVSTSLLTTCAIETIDPLLGSTDRRILSAKDSIQTGLRISVHKNVGARPEQTPPPALFNYIEYGCFESIIQLKITCLQCVFNGTLGCFYDLWLYRTGPSGQAIWDCCPKIGSHHNTEKGRYWLDLACGYTPRPCNSSRRQLQVVLHIIWVDFHASIAQVPSKWVTMCHARHIPWKTGGLIPNSKRPILQSGRMIRTSCSPQVWLGAGCIRGTFMRWPDWTSYQVYCYSARCQILLPL